MLILLALLFATTPDPVRTITPIELRDAMLNHEAVVIDVRGSVPYDLGHIDGAISMPLGLVAQRATELPQDKLIVAYCSCRREELSDQAVRQLATHGYTNAAALKGGYDAWAGAGLPVVRHVEEEQQPAGRRAVPSFVTCNDVTSYIGEVVSYQRGRRKTVIRINTDEKTTEEVTIPNDPIDSFFVLGAKFTKADWPRIESKHGVLRPHMRVIAWVCRSSGKAWIDWHPGETRASGG